MKTGLRARLLTLLAALPLLLATAVYAGIFEDLSMMGPKFPKKAKDSREDLILVKFKDAVPPSQRDAKHVQEGNVKVRELPRSGVHVVQISPALTVGGGTGEVQRNIVAERVLGLPHDVDVEQGQTWASATGRHHDR